MNALYTVFTEITDTLSLNYVVNATLREAMRLMDADTVVLRLVKDGELVVLGSLSRSGEPVEGLEPHTLGEDPLGRVAKRGKPLRIDHTNQELLSGRQREDGQRSGIVIPLIIGARVVGTLGVWSAREDAFNEEDERILGMMCSQVATAIVAADTTETSVHRAHHDPLTGLPNRLQLMEDLARDLSPARLTGRRATVAMVDIDHFKHFNDDFGHHVGDVSLQKVAQTLRLSLRETDRVYRYGGEEFVVVFMDAGREEGLALAERLRSAVEATPLTGDQLESAGPVTISLGVAFYPDDAPNINTLIELADAAMYQAKTHGRNRVIVWQPDILTGAA